MAKYKTLSTKDFVNLCIENYNNKEESIKLSEQKMDEDRLNASMMNEQLLETQTNYNKNVKNYREFTEGVKSTLLGECIYKIFNEAMGIHFSKGVNNGIKKGLVKSFIEENGTNALLSRFKTTSNMLYEMACLVEETYFTIMEKVDKTDPSTYVIEPEDKDKFFEKLEEKDTKDITSAIRNRVSDAMEEFITTNANSKMQIEDILTKTQEKINDTEEKTVKESYQNIAKSRIATVRSKNINSVFSSMVYSLSEHAVKNESFKETYTKNGKLDMDAIVEKCEILYTFLETVNTTKMISMDEVYLNGVLDNMKN